MAGCRTGESRPHNSHRKKREASVILADGNGNSANFKSYDRNDCAATKHRKYLKHRAPCRKLWAASTLCRVRKQRGWRGHAGRMPVCDRLGAALNISSDRDLGALWLQQMSLFTVLDQDHRPSNQWNWRPATLCEVLRNHSFCPPLACVCVCVHTV